TFLAGMRFAMDDSSPDYPALVVGNEVLGVSFTSRLWDRLRQKEGLCYGTGSRVSVGAKDKVSQLGIFATCAPTNIDKVNNGAVEELQKLLKEGITQDELKLAVKATLEEMKIERGKDSSLVSSLRSGLYLGRTFEWQAELEKKISA